MATHNKFTILCRVAAGESAAVRECVDRYGDMVWRLARRYLRNSADAEDAVQDIFIDIWRSAARYDAAIASEAAFITTITRRRLIDRVRRSGRQPLTTSLDDELYETEQPSVEATCEYDAELQIVERMLSTLDAQSYRVLSMAVLEGFTHTEIAERLHLPLGTVKSRVRRGLILVRNLLQPPVAGQATRVATG